MIGKVLAYDTASENGVISGEDGSRYAFKAVEWKLGDTPEVGMSVDFIVDGEKAKEIYTPVIKKNEDMLNPSNSTTDSIAEVSPEEKVEKKKMNIFLKTLLLPVLIPWWLVKYSFKFIWFILGFISFGLIVPLNGDD